MLIVLLVFSTIWSHASFHTLGSCNLSHENLKNASTRTCECQWNWYIFNCFTCCVTGQHKPVKRKDSSLYKCAISGSASFWLMGWMVFCCNTQEPCFSPQMFLHISSTDRPWGPCLVWVGFDTRHAWCSPNPRVIIPFGLVWFSRTLVFISCHLKLAWRTQKDFFVDILVPLCAVMHLSPYVSLTIPRNLMVHVMM